MRDGAEYAAVFNYEKKHLISSISMSHNTINYGSLIQGDNGQNELSFCLNAPG